MAICTIFCAFVGCASSNPEKIPVEPDINHFICLPERNSLIFLGVSGPMYKPEAEIDAAREDAARKAAMYHGLTASFTSTQGMGTNALDYYSDSNFQMEYDQELDRYIDKLTYNPEHDVTNSSGAIFIRFSYPGIYPVDINYKSAKEADGSPEWIKHPPLEIEGFMAQVGFARRQLRIRDTIAKANEDAIANLISRSSSSLKISDTVNNDSTSSVITQQSSGKLLYFMILETWINPEDLSVWNLTIARNTN